MALDPDAGPSRTLEVGLLLQLGAAFERPATEVEWAVTALTEGFDSPSLRILAGADLDGSPSPFETSPLFRAALTELGILLPELEVLARLYVREVARQVVGGTLEPRTAADLVHRRVVTPLEHPTDLMSWCYVWKGNSVDCSRPLDDEELEHEIHRLAIEFAGESV